MGAMIRLQIWSGSGASGLHRSLLVVEGGESVNRTALVYEGHLAPIVEADGYFDAIIPFRRLLGI